MKLTFHSFDLQLKHTFRIAHDSRDVQPTLIVALSHGEHIGFGEATATRYYGKSVDSMIRFLESKRQIIERYDLSFPEKFINSIANELREDSFAQCAVDVAIHDLYGKSIGSPLYQYWGLKLNELPVTSYTIGIDEVSKMIEKMNEFPWPIYKIKLGTNDDLAIIKALRKETSSIFRVDANCAWTPDETIRLSGELAKLNVEFIEQPLSPDDWDGMKRVYAKSKLPVIADESCIKEIDVKKCHQYFHGINIKLMKCGGLIPAKRMIENANKLNLKVMVGCMTESSVGISAISQLLPILDYVDMDGAALIKNDIARGAELKEGKVILSSGNGTGVSMIENIE